MVMVTRIIKRYANRKLYDTEHSRYVTLEEIGEMVKAGEDLQIIDNRTGEDLTGVTLTQIIFEDQKRPEQSSLPVSALRGIIQSGGEFLTKLSQPVTSVGADLRRRANKLEENSQAALREFLESTTRKLDETQSRIDESVKSAVDQMTHIPTLQEELRQSQLRVSRLEKQVAGLIRTVEELREANLRLTGPESIPSQKSNPTRAL